MGFGSTSGERFDRGRVLGGVDDHDPRREPGLAREQRQRERHRIGTVSCCHHDVVIKTAHRILPD